MKARVISLAVAAAMASTAAFAAPVASTSKKGSLLVFPVININPEANADTLIEISNDYPATVHVECKYINEWKGRVDFDFDLTSKQTVSWNVGTKTGDHVNPPPFPPSGNWPIFGSKYRGELICYAVSSNLSTQVAWNHLHGNATVTVRGSSFQYNPWAFQALDANGEPNTAVNVAVGYPGKILLRGLPNTYDACPLYNVTTFMPNGASLSPISSTANFFGFSGCNQDLRQDYRVYRTKLQFEKVWNSNEQGFSGSYYCADSVGSLGLGGTVPNLVAGTNFDYSTLATANARFQVQGVASTQCPYSSAVGVLGVHWATIYNGSATQLVGSEMHAAGSTQGFVYWDPGASTVPTLAPAK